jgi:polyhydroxyalkanoate synthesis regulator phasin
MGKYNLGSVSTEVKGIHKDVFYMNEAKAKRTVNDIIKQLESMEASLINIHLFLNQSVSCGVVKGIRAKSYKGWARKAKSQANAIEKLKNNLIASFNEDLRNYPLKLLDDRIAELERRISNMTNE